MGNYFCGWYFRQLNDKQSLAVIPSFHKTKNENFCTIQLLTDRDAFYLQFPDTDFHRKKDEIQIGNNRFGLEGLSLDIHRPELQAEGTLRFYGLSPIRYDIMGPFRYVPFLQCRHSVYSMHHRVEGEITVNGIPYSFRDGIGYTEGDRGRAFPKRYVWAQCSFPEGALMLSIGDIPLGGVSFTGVIGIVLLHGKEYRLATYLGAKAAKITPAEIIVKQGKYRLILAPGETVGFPLRAPAEGGMNRTIHEHPACKIACRFEENGIPLLDLECANAAFEYAYE